jgi:hypothetical protein
LTDYLKKMITAEYGNRLPQVSSSGLATASNHHRGQITLTQTPRYDASTLHMVRVKDYYSSIPSDFKVGDNAFGLSVQHIPIN